MIQNSLWKLLGIILAVVLIFIVPMVWEYQRQDQMINDYVCNETKAFSQKIQEIGYLDRALYHDFVNRLQLTGTDYQIEMEHLQKRFKANAAAGDQVEAYYDGYYLTDIIEKMDKGEKYRLRMGDFFFVTIKNRSNTKTQAINRLIGIKSGGVGIYYKSGGVVRYAAP